MTRREPCGWPTRSRGFRNPSRRALRSGHAGSLAPYFAAFDFLAVPLEEVQESFARLGYERGLRFVPGFFEDTLPGFAGGERRWAVLRLDGDTYDVTLLALRCLYPNLSPGGYVIIDDYQDIDECRQAVDDFRREHGIEEPLEQVDWTCAKWRRVSDTSIDPFEASAQPPAAPRKAVQTTPAATRPDRAGARIRAGGPRAHHAAR